MLAVDAAQPDIPASKIRDIAAIVDDEAVLPDELLSFVERLASYYFAPIGEALRLALPAVERDQLRQLANQGKLHLGQDKLRSKKAGARKVKYAQATASTEPPGTLRGQAAAILALLRSGGERSVARLADDFGNARNALRKLEKAGLVEVVAKEQERAPIFEAAERDTPPELNAAQREAVDQIEQGEASAFLLFGITGSGKTEVYMHAIESCLAKGRGALMLVPEIALTPQVVGRFRARFGDEIGVLHSGLADVDRHAMWKKLRSGTLRVAVGARSALFAPVADLGLVVVDEEHDGSFKQEEGVRYHARDMALLRAHRAGAVAVLGSATPSLESIALVERSKLVRIDLPERATAATLPKVELVDLRRMGAGPSGDRRISLPLHRALEKTLSAKEQAIVFLNRRGFAPAVICEGCGTSLSCKQCAVALTWHRRNNALRCHYCDYHSPLPSHCPDCKSPKLSLEGLGTEKLEETLATCFPEARIARLDRDVAGGNRSAKILKSMRQGKIDILVGTQMVTKGHDLPNVTLVGVINADAALSMPDFRAAERSFQLLVQVAGRAGRHERQGRVLIQTRKPEHAAIAAASRHDVTAFHKAELLDRRDLGYPPYCHLALLRVDSLDEKKALRHAAQLAALARGHEAASRGDVTVLGPAPAPIVRLRNRWRFRVMLRCSTRPPLRHVVADVACANTPSGIRCAIDIDPVSML